MVVIGAAVVVVGIGPVEMLVVTAGATTRAGGGFPGGRAARSGTGDDVLPMGTRRAAVVTVGVPPGAL